MILSDTSLRHALSFGRIGFTPIATEQQIQPASIDVMLGRHFRAFKNAGLQQQPSAPSVVNRTPLDVANFDADVEMETFEADYLLLGPHEFCLGTTSQSIRLPADLRGHLFGRSSLARLGLVVHTVAGNLDPGFEGDVTLELLNVGSRILKIPVGWRVAHISFEELDQAAAMPYGMKKNSKYQGQRGATASRISNDTKYEGDAP